MMTRTGYNRENLSLVRFCYYGSAGTPMIINNLLHKNFTKFWETMRDKADVWARLR